MLKKEQMTAGAKVTLRQKLTSRTAGIASIGIGGPETGLTIYTDSGIHRIFGGETLTVVRGPKNETFGQLMGNLAIVETATGIVGRIPWTFLRSNSDLEA